jgi:hypothetical protein
MENKWQLCPKCNGQGTVEKPPHIPGDVHQWTSSSCSFVCDVCNGAKIIAPPMPEIDPDDISDISEAEYPKDYERVKGHDYDINLQARTAYIEGIKKGIELIKGK